MKDKYTYDLIEGLDNIEDLDIDFDSLINDEELNSIGVDINQIRKKTYEKVGTSKLQKFKTKKIVNLIASVSLILLIGTPVALGFVKQLYKYDKTSGSIMKSTDPLYILKEPITKKVGNGEITITSFVVNPKDGNVTVNEEARNIDGFEYFKEDIFVDGKKITDDTYTKVNKTWSKHTGTYFDYKDNHEYKYVATLMDKEKNTTKIEFDIDLEEATSVEEYNKNLPKDTKNDIVMSAITTEEDNSLYVELMAIPGVDNMEFSVDSYGNYVNENKGSNIWIVDAKGEKVEGEYCLEDNKSNTFKFDIENLERPFTLEVEDITVSNENKGIDVDLPRIKFGEKIELNMVINLEDKNNLLTKENNNIHLKTVERKNSNGCDTIILDVEYMDNNNSDFELQFVRVESHISWFGLGKFDYGSSSQEIVKDNNRRIKMNLSDSEDESYTGRRKSKKIGFNISAQTYKIKGPWKIIIE